MITLFSWGYWGWGSATKEFVQAVDALEKRRGFKSPVFADIRYSRAVRAKGFNGSAFEHLLGPKRYQHLRELGNQSIRTKERRMHIVEPKAANRLLDLAISAHKDRRRVIFFCSCKDVDLLRCHRHKVTKLVLKAAAQAGRKIEVIEWPGGKPENTSISLDSAVFDSMKEGGTLPLAQKPGRFALLPWGTVLTANCGEQSMHFVTGPAKYHDTWRLKILKLGNETDGLKKLKKWSEQFRKKHGFDAYKGTETR